MITCMCYWFCRCRGPIEFQMGQYEGHILYIDKHSQKDTVKHNTRLRTHGCHTSTPARALIWGTQERKGWWSGALSLNMYIGCEETHHSHSQSLIHTRIHTHWHKHANAWQFPGELTTLDWWHRQSSICFVISLSLSLLSLFHSLIVTVLVRPVWINHQSLCSSSVPLPLPFSHLTSPYASHSLSIYYRQSLFHMNPLSTMGTKQMCVSNPDGVIPML